MMLLMLCDWQVEKLLRAVADGDVEMVSTDRHQPPPQLPQAPLPLTVCVSGALPVGVDG